MIDRERLEEDLRQQAWKIGNSRFFWEEMTDAIIRGDVLSINPHDHLVRAKKPESISQDIHNIISSKPWSEVSKEERVIYLEIVKTVVAGLGYKK